MSIEKMVATGTGVVLLLLGAVITVEGMNIIPQVLPLSYHGELRWTGLGIAILIAGISVFFLIQRTSRNSAKALANSQK